MNRIMLLVPVIAILLLACSPGEDQPDVPMLDMEMETIHEIGSDTTAWFAFPRYLVADSLGRIVVGDNFTMDLKVFDSSGKFQKTIASQGPGPAEIEQLRGLGIDGNGNLLVYDAGSNLIKVFTIDGRLLDSHILPESVSSTVAFAQADNHHLLFYSLFNPGSENNYLMHRYDAGFDSLVSKGMAVQHFEELEETDEIAPFLANGIGSPLRLRNDRLLFAPVIYGGVISEFSLKEPAEEPLQKYPGVIHKKPYSFIGEVTNDVYVDAARYTPNGSVGVLIHNQSKGLFRLSSGEIIHFTNIEKADGSARVFGAELYDERMSIWRNPPSGIFIPPGRQKCITVEYCLERCGGPVLYHRPK